MTIQIASLPSPIMFASNTSPRPRACYRPMSPMSDNDSIDIIDSACLDIQRALDIARNTEGDLDHTVSQYLETQLVEVWDRLESQPETYVLTKDEFAIFNFFIFRYNGSQVAEKAIARFWSNYQDSGRPSQIH